MFYSFYNRFVFALDHLNKHKSLISEFQISVLESNPPTDEKKMQKSVLLSVKFRHINTLWLQHTIMSKESNKVTNKKKFPRDDKYY